MNIASLSKYFVFVAFAVFCAAVSCSDEPAGAGIEDGTERDPSDGETDRGEAPDGFDAGDLSPAACEPVDDLIVEPIWIAGGSGSRDQLGAFGKPDAIILTPEGILLAGDEDGEYEEIHLFDVRTEDPGQRAEFLAPLADWGADPGPGGSGQMEFRAISGFAQHPESGDLFIVEQGNFRIQVLTPTDPPDEAPYFTFDRFIGVRASDPDAPADGEFVRLQAARFDSAGRLFVSDDAKRAAESSRRDIQVFDTDGNFLDKFGDGSYGPLGRQGNLQEPENFAIDEERNRIYVCDEGPSNIAVFAYDDFSFITRFETAGVPNGVDLDSDGLLYVMTEGAESETSVQVYEPDDFGELTRFGGFSEEDDLRPGYFNSPDTLIIDNERDLLIIADQGHDRIQGFRLSEIQMRTCISPDAAPGSSGDVLITEFMKNVANTPDDDAEWIELYNPSDTESYDLRGCTLTDEGNEYIVPTRLIVDPSSYVTLGRSADSAVVGFTPDHSYGATIKLSDGADTISVFCNSTLIDEVSYDAGETFPDERGFSVTLSNDAFSAEANDLGENWCSGQSEYATNEYGTPGEANDECPQ